MYSSLLISVLRRIVGTTPDREPTPPPRMDKGKEKFRWLPRDWFKWTTTTMTRGHMAGWWDGGMAGGMAEQARSEQRYPTHLMIAIPIDNCTTASTPAPVSVSSALTCRLSAQRLYECLSAAQKRVTVLFVFDTYKIDYPLYGYLSSLIAGLAKNVHTPHHAAELPSSSGCRRSIDAVLERRTLDFLVAAGDSLRLLFDFNMILNPKSHDLPTHEVVPDNGQTIPAIGLGELFNLVEDEMSDLVTAQEHGNRNLIPVKSLALWNMGSRWAIDMLIEVGDGLRASGVPREEVFITSKLWGTYHRRVEECLDQTLANLGTTYLDIYLMHWPIPLNLNGNDPLIPILPNGNIDLDESRDIGDTWKAMEVMVKKGKVKAIGTLNLSQMMLEKILPTSEIILALELPSPSKKTIPQAYSPLGSTGAPLLTDESATEIAKKRDLKSTSDVLLGYLLKKDIVVLPKSMSPSRIESNLTSALEAYNLLTPEDINILDGVAAGGKQNCFATPPWGIDLSFESWSASAT
ncbi:NADP-dependent oxidoreductase domain-containing protein [Suillus tomentosus]|nr:NADP-dependent oxidoreductase domain-containing protein [Suillus tomentosus]